MTGLQRARNGIVLSMAILMAAGCFPLDDNSNPRQASRDQVVAALAHCSVPEKYLFSVQGDLTIKFPDGVSNTANQRRCIDAYLQRRGVSVSIAWRDNSGR